MTRTTEMALSILATVWATRRGTDVSVPPRETLAHVIASLRLPQSRWWFVAAVFIALVGWCVAVGWEAVGWNTLRTAKVVPLGAPVEAAGKDVGVFTDFLQPGRAINCVNVGPDNKTTAIAPSPVSMQVVSEGTTWHLIALTTDGTKSMKIQCTAADKLVDSAVYGTAVVDAANTRTGTPIAWLFGLIALGLAGATVWGRRAS